MKNLGKISVNKPQKHLTILLVMETIFQYVFQMILLSVCHDINFRQLLGEQEKNHNKYSTLIDMNALYTFYIHIHLHLVYCLYVSIQWRRKGKQGTCCGL